MSVINVRGTSGSGKTTVARGQMTMGDVIPLPGDEGTAKKPEAYSIATQGKPLLYLIGSYENVCGGCDGVPTQDEICRRVRKYAPMGDVLMEGLLMSHLFSRYRDLDRELHAQGIPFIWAFLDTPLEVCLDRVQARRNARFALKGGVQKPFNPKNTIDKWHDMRSVYGKAIDAGLDARWVPYETATEVVASWR